MTLEAFEGYWRKVPRVKRLVFRSLPDETTRAAALKRGDVDIAYFLNGPIAEDVRNDAGAQAHGGAQQHHLLPRLPRPVGRGLAVAGSASPAGGQRGHRPRGAQRARSSWASRGSRAMSCRAPWSSRCPSTPTPTIRRAPAAPRRGGLRERLRRGRFHHRAALRRRGRGDRELSGRRRHPHEDTHDGARRLLLGLAGRQAQGRALRRTRSRGQCGHPAPDPGRQGRPVRGGRACRRSRTSSRGSRASSTDGNGRSCSTRSRHCCTIGPSSPRSGRTGSSAAWAHGWKSRRSP